MKMNRWHQMFLCAAIFVSMTAVAKAGVTFLPQASSSMGGVATKSTGSGGVQIAPSQKCKNQGYTVMFCKTPMILSDQCPYDSSYYKSCSCPSAYSYTKEECIAAGASYEQCGTSYRCY
jgi:hypothetical protein